MDSTEKIVATMTEWDSRSIPFALATVVGVRGSTYRGLGARQLVSAEGSSVGTVSGGCLDQDLNRVAQEVIEEGKPQLVEFDLTADDEAIWGWGIGCNGATELVIEPTTTALRLVEMWKMQFSAREALALCHVLTAEPCPELSPGMFGVWTTAGVNRIWPQDHQHRGAVNQLLGIETVGEILAAGQHRLIEKDGFRLLVEVIGGPPRLVICGAGHDAVPLAQYGSELGFQVVVTDERKAFLTTDRFGTEPQLIYGNAADIASLLELDSRTAVVIMTHNYLRDLDYLTAISDQPPFYVGMLGPGARLERLWKDMEEGGHTITADFSRRVYGPAGLDIGAEGPEQIAWSIMAEIISVRANKEGGSLRQRKGPKRLLTSSAPTKTD